MRFKIAALALLCALSCFSADPALTIYNQQFAVIRETIPLDLKSGLNQGAFAGATAPLEPESVMLRGPSGQRVLRVVEQNYRADPVSLEALLKRYEGQTIDFQVRNGDRVEAVAGKIIRAGGLVGGGQPVLMLAQWNNQYQPQQPGVSQPIVEVAGKLRFELPGMPLFRGLTARMIL